VSDVVAGWQARIREAAAQRTPLRLRGGGSKDFYGEAAMGEVIDTTAYAGLIDFEATMAEQGQMLAFEPPHFAAGATIGGAVASGLSGPRRPYAGAVRDLVLGVRVLDGQGADLTFGGRVMKNVAGFDVSRLMTGAMGTLGLLLDVSLKCLPLPRTQRTLVFELAPDAAIARMNAWGGKPLPISATCHYDGRLCVRLAGAAPAVDAAARMLGGTVVPDDVDFWRSVRDHTLPFFRNAQELWRLSVRSTAPDFAPPGTQLIEWGGALRWIAAASGVDAARMRNLAAAHGGHATLFRADEPHTGVFHPLQPALLDVHRRLKSTFDPAGIMNPGRLYPSL
jgi:glycolate oxidase FAD binding subunit